MHSQVAPGGTGTILCVRVRAGAGVPRLHQDAERKGDASHLCTVVASCRLACTTLHQVLTLFTVVTDQRRRVRPRSYQGGAQGPRENGLALRREAVARG